MYKILPILLFAYGLALTTDDIYDNSYALVIGIDKYENVSNLDYAVEDAKSIKKMLIDKFQFSNDKITLLLNKDATYRKIKKSLSKVTRQAGDNDRILIFFSGHGETVSLPEGGAMGFLVPVDGEKDDLYATSLEMDELRKVTTLSKAKHILYLVDACYGGLAASNTKSLNISTPGFLEKITRDKSRQIITAGGRGEKVIEKAEWGHSAFTLNILRGLEDWTADTNLDGFITAEELGLFLKNRVTKDSDNQQTPQSRRFSSHEGEFVFINDNSNTSINFNSDNEDIGIDYDKLARKIVEKMNKKDGCTDKEACNYDETAVNDDGSCDYSCQDIVDIKLFDYDEEDSTVSVLIKSNAKIAGLQFDVGVPIKTIIYVKVNSNEAIHGIQYDIQYNPTEIFSVIPQDIPGFEVKYGDMSEGVSRGLIFSMQHQALPDTLAFEYNKHANWTGSSKFTFSEIILANNQGNNISIDKFNEYEIKFFSYTIPVNHKEDTPNLTNASISVYKESTSTFEVDVLPELLNATGGILSEHDFMVSTNSTSFIAFSMTGDKFSSPDYSLLTILKINNFKKENNFCLNGIVLSDKNGIALRLSDNSKSVCYY